MCSANDSVTVPETTTLFENAVCRQYGRAPDIYSFSLSRASGHGNFQRNDNHPRTPRHHANDE